MSDSWLWFVFGLLMVSLKLSNSLLDFIAISFYTGGVFCGGMSLGAKMHKEGKIR